MITVNGRVIDERSVAAEMQHHPAPSAEQAFAAAAEALVVRELLRQRAQALGIDTDDENAATEALLAREVRVPEPDEATCRRYYETHRTQFRSLTLFEAAHILIAASPDDKDACNQAREIAAQLIVELRQHPERFAGMAEAWSACPSKLNGGRLGQVARGDTVPEFETFLDNLDEGQLCPVPVPTRFGAHVLRLDRRIDGRELPFDLAAQQIANHLCARSWQIAVKQYVARLAEAADVQGVALPEPGLPSSGLAASTGQD